MDPERNMTRGPTPGPLMTDLLLDPDHHVHRGPTAADIGGERGLGVALDPGANHLIGQGLDIPTLGRSHTPDTDLNSHTSGRAGGNRTSM